MAPATGDGLVSRLLKSICTLRERSEHGALAAPTKGRASERRESEH